MEDTSDDVFGALRRLAAERHGDPFRALPEVRALLDRPDLGIEASGFAWWIEGLLHHECGEPDEAVAAFERAIRWARHHGLPDVEARACGNLAITLTQLGRAGEAAEHLDHASRVAPPSARGFVTYLRALFAQRRGLHVEAIAAYGEAHALLLAAGDVATIGVLHLNRGVARAYMGAYAAAHDDFARAEAVALDHHLVILAAMAAHNAAFCDGRRGRLADALLAMDRAERWYDKLDGQPRQLPVLYSDRAEILLLAGLVDDAHTSVRRAVAELSVNGNRADLTEALLLLARICLAGGRPADARVAALDAARGFRTARRPAWVAHALYVGRQADLALARATDRAAPELSRRFERLAVPLERHGWPVEASDALVCAALGIVDEDVAHARLLLARTGRHREASAAPYRARWYHARALTALARGRPDTADRYVHTGVRDTRRVAEQSGATDATLEALRHAGELARLGVEIAHDSGDVDRLWRAVERRRSLVSLVPRIGARSIDAAPCDVEPDQSADDEDARRQQALRTRPARTEITRPDWAALRAGLGSLALVHYEEVREELLAVVVEGPGTRCVRLGPVQQAVDGVQYLTFALTSLAMGSPAVVERAHARFERDREQLDAVLVAPLGLTRQEAVIVPSPQLGGVLWSLLPSLADVDVTLAPSGADWWRARTTERPSTGRTVLVAGPGLPAAVREIDRLRELHPGATVLGGAAATTADVLEAMDGADLVHVAAHGVFRLDSPMFSRLDLVDGALTVYDLEGLRRPPHTVVLSACETGAARLYASGGTIGIARALLAVGSAVVVAPTLAVEDEATCDHMVAFHRRLAGGVSPAAALRLATAEALGSADRQRIAAAAAFVAIGSS